MKLERLKYLRENDSMSQKKLADKLGISQNLVFKWESGSSSPNPEMLKKIACLFHVSVDYLIGNSNVSERVENSIPMDIQNIISEAEGISSEGLEDIKKYAQLVKLKEASEKAKDAARSSKQEKRS